MPETGTFIAPNLILTCAHNVLDRKMAPNDGKIRVNRLKVVTKVEFYPSSFPHLGDSHESTSIKKDQQNMYIIGR